MRYLILFVIVLFAFSCDKKQEVGYKINRIGSLQSIMHQGNLAANISLDTLRGKNIFGLGALDSLKGELLILDNHIYKSTVQHNSIYTEIDPKAQASLLVYAEINAWDTVMVDGFVDVSVLVSEKGKALGMEEPFPFLLLGKPASLSYHVINFDPKVHDIGNHKQDAFKGEITEDPVVILGFYSTRDKGIFTHHDSFVHLHFIDETKAMAGHVDEFIPGDNAFKLLIPKR